MIAFMIAGIALLVLAHVVLAGLMARVAQKKGYGKDAHCFAICLCLGFAGCLYVMALPDLEQRKQLDTIIELLKTERSEPEKQTNRMPRFDEPEKAKGDAEKFFCETLTPMGEELIGECAMCNQKPQTIRPYKIKNANGYQNLCLCKNCLRKINEYNSEPIFS